ncbi:hypothetical protein H696_04187 [Fonticula alba]|uniref:Uncharacterized protein n=1 Tax=Fonticula alba TaxID=691883 RepID=A0A058Z649_FONAL|nr:hypothetical protein H696_04187 [Fonticula alba]KCV69774.1 hypothetical protein H696_04187 [Fonticula alba]|eukprot:XP_009496339.1 hypothetical protein H696_04187 [Fonticula alba]
MLASRATGRALRAWGSPALAAAAARWGWPLPRRDTPAPGGPAAPASGPMAAPAMGMGRPCVRGFSSAGAAPGPGDGPCAGERLCRAIEAGREPLPQGFDDVAHFRLFLRLVGDPREGRPLAPLGTLGRLLGMDRSSVQALLSQYGREFGIAPAKRPLSLFPEQVVGPGDPIFEDMMGLIRRDPPVLGAALSRLLCLLPRQVEGLLAEHAAEILDEAERDQGVCIRRLGHLVTVAPPLSKQTMATLLSTSLLQLTAAMRRHFPEHGVMVVPKASPAKLEALRAVLADRTRVPVPRLAEICTLADVCISTVATHGPTLCPEYVVRLRGELSPKKVARLRALLREQCHSIRAMSRDLGQPARYLRWYIKYYEPGVVLPAGNDQPVYVLALPDSSTRLTLAEYMRRFLPAASPLHGTRDEDIPARAANWMPGTVADDGASESDAEAPAAPGPEPGPGPPARMSVQERNQALEVRLQGLCGLRPALSPAEVLEQMGIPWVHIDRALASFEWPKDLWDARRRLASRAPSDEGIRRLRQLASQVHPSGRRMRHTVRELAAELGQEPDVVFTMLHQYAPEYFFLAVAPEAKSGLGGIYVPEEKLADLLAAVHGRHPAPVLHQVAADLGCTLPQVVNSLRADAFQRGIQFKAPSYARHLASRTFQVEQVLALYPGMQAAHMCSMFRDLLPHHFYRCQRYIVSQ